MADLGSIGLSSLGDFFQYVAPGDVIGTSGYSESFPAPQFRPFGGIAQGDFDVIKQSLENGAALRIEGRSVYGETQLNGTPTPMFAVVTSNGVVVDRYLSTPELIIRDLQDYMPYEITVFGGGAQRTETWGVSSVTAHADLTLTGDLDPCTASVAYSSGLTAAGGFGDPTWDIWGSLPAGLSFDTGTGLITGTTAAAGTYSLDIGVTLEGVRRWKNVSLVVT